MTTNTTNFYYQQYHPSQSSLLQPTTTTTDNTDFNKLDKDIIYKYKIIFFSYFYIFFNMIFFSHPLFPLLAIIFDKCELATNSPRDGNNPNYACSLTSFNEDVIEFTKQVKFKDLLKFNYSFFLYS
jgi:hypothetical protein